MQGLSGCCTRFFSCKPVGWAMSFFSDSALTSSSFSFTDKGVMAVQKDMFLRRTPCSIYVWGSTQI